MRHNLSVLVENPRTGALRRARRLIGLFAAVLAVASLVGGMGASVAAAAGGTGPFASGLGEASPAAESTVKPIADQVAIVGKPFSMTIEGTELHEIVAVAGLPAELTP